MKRCLHQTWFVLVLHYCKYNTTFDTQLCFFYQLHTHDKLGDSIGYVPSYQLAAGSPRHSPTVTILYPRALAHAINTCIICVAVCSYTSCDSTICDSVVVDAYNVVFCCVTFGAGTRESSESKSHITDAL